MIRLISTFLLLLSHSAFSFEEDITYAFGIEIGGEISQNYLDEKNNQYPTRLIYVDVPTDYELNVFENLQVQLIESSKRVYSVIAEIESEKCDAEIKQLFKFFDEKYESLKILRHIKLNGKVLSTFDGYLSSDGKRKLSVYCSTAEGSDIEMLGVSIWQNELADQASSLWEKYGN